MDPATVKMIVELTADAYSFDRYGLHNWAKTAETLLLLGFDMHETMDLLRSKYMRWAADHCPNDQNLDTALARYIIENKLTVWGLKHEIASW
jgi:hypothetical protein